MTGVLITVFFFSVFDGCRNGDTQGRKQGAQCNIISNFFTNTLRHPVSTFEKSGITIVSLVE